MRGEIPVGLKPARGRHRPHYLVKQVKALVLPNKYQKQREARNGAFAPSIPAWGTRKEKSKSFGSPRFARRLVCIQFWG